MYKVASVSANVSDVGYMIKQTIDSINNAGGTITHIVQSSASTTTGIIIVSVTIIYQPESRF